MSEYPAFTVKCIETGRSHGYNRSTARYRVEVSAFDKNVEVPVIQERVKNMIRAMYPDSHGIGNGTLMRLQYEDIVRIDEVPSNRQDGKPWEYHVGVWTFDYETAGCD